MNRFEQRLQKRLQQQEIAKGYREMGVEMEQDFLDEMIEESTKSNPEFPSLMEEARQRRALLDTPTAIQISQSPIAEEP